MCAFVCAGMDGNFDLLRDLGTLKDELQCRVLRS